MTTKTQKKCSNCGKTIFLTVWKLGHKDTDSVDCPNCGNLLFEWKNEAKSYMIIKNTRHI